MNNHGYTLDNIRNQAKKVKKERNISHSTALDLVARNLGYSNWGHCHKSLSLPMKISDELEKGKISLDFNSWLVHQKNRNSPLGDLAQEMLKNETWPTYTTLEEYQAYFNTQDFPLGASRALHEGWKSYKRYVKSLSAPKSIKAKSIGQVPIKSKFPKMVIIKKATPIPFTKRTVEKFNPGDLAWISWNGRKAIPVTIIDVDERHYTFRVERSLKKAGNKHFLFLDEVRSTPELACMNYVTN